MDPTESSPRQRRHGGLGRYRPGPKELVIFAALVVLGLLVWFANSPGITTSLFGVNLSPLNPEDPGLTLFLTLFFTLLVCSVLALISGFVFPRGFYLWGIALNLHAPFTEWLTIYMMEQEGIGLVGGTRGILSYGAITAMLIVGGMFLYTALSALGMGLRYLVRSSP